MGVCYSVSGGVSKAVIVERLLRLAKPRRESRRCIVTRLLVLGVMMQALEESLVGLFSCGPVPGRGLFDLNGICLQSRPMWLTGVSHVFPLVPPGRSSVCREPFTNAMHLQPGHAVHIEHCICCGIDDPSNFLYTECARFSLDTTAGDCCGYCRNTAVRSPTHPKFESAKPHAY